MCKTTGPALLLDIIKNYRIDFQNPHLNFDYLAYNINKRWWIFKMQTEDLIELAKRVQSQQAEA